MLGMYGWALWIQTEMLLDKYVFLMCISLPTSVCPHCEVVTSQDWWALNQIKGDGFPLNYTYWLRFCWCCYMCVSELLILSDLIAVIGILVTVTGCAWLVSQLHARLIFSQFTSSALHRNVRDATLLISCIAFMIKSRMMIRWETCWIFKNIIKDKYNQKLHLCVTSDICCVLH